MKKIILISILSLCIFTIRAQQNISVSITTKVIKNEVYILSTITNNNSDFVVISATGITDSFGYVADGSNSYITLNSYDTNGILIGKSNKVFIPRNLNNSKIKLQKGESYQKLDRFYSFDGFYGYYNEHFGTELSKIQGKFHLLYVLYKTVSAEIHEVDILSNEIMSKNGSFFIHI